MTTLAAKNPEIFIAMTAGTSCTQSVTEAAQNGLKDKAKYLFQPSVCKSNASVGKDKVGGDGAATHGWWVVGGGTKVAESTAYDNDAWVKAIRDVMTNAGVDWKKETVSLTGSQYAWGYEQLIMSAAMLPGGLTRANLIVALRSFDMTSPFLLEGGKFNLNGNKDSYLTESSEFGKYDSVKQGFE